MSTHQQFEQLGEWLTAHHWVYDANRDRQSIRMRVKGEACNYDVLIALHDELDVLGFYTVFPFNVPADKRLRVSETVLRANDGMKLGGFQLDVDSGWLRFHIGVPVNDARLSEEQFMRSLHLGIYISERYFGAFQRVLYTDASPRTAVAEVENPTAHLN